MIDEKKRDEIFLELGFVENLSGTEYLREAVTLYDGGSRSMCREVYPAIAEEAGITAAAVERSMRSSINKAWLRGSLDTQLKCFGYSIDPERGRPTCGEFVARMARVCREMDGQR